VRLRFYFEKMSRQLCNEGRRGIQMMTYVGLMATGSMVQSVNAATIFVAPKGADNAAGTQDAPVATVERAEALAQPGDTVFMRGGTYAFKSATAEAGVTLTKAGTASKRRFYFAYPGEKPVFDFTGLSAAKRIKGVWVKADWLHIRGIEMFGVQQTASMQAHENWCVYVQGGSHNIFESLDLHHNMGPGLFIVDGGANLILNCDSHDNWDAYSYAGTTPAPGENADGFGFHSRNPDDTGTVFRGCRAWWNADDGWDFINAYAPAVVENSWAWLNGYKAGTTTASGNGNGFKMGGFGMPPVVPTTPIPKHTVRNCIGFLNRAAGFYQNHHPVVNYYYNNTSFNNRAANFNLLGYGLSNSDDQASMGVLRNNIAFTGTALSNATSGSGVDAKNNSWNLSVTVSADDFESTDTAGVGGPRKADGSLPDIRFLKIKAGSDLIDKGVDVGLLYAGSAPDLGARESNLPVALRAQRGKLEPIYQGSHMQAYNLVGRREADPVFSGGLTGTPIRLIP
jgi:Right handed beta helix region